MIGGLGVSESVGDGEVEVAEAVPVSVVAEGTCVVGNGVIVSGVSVMVVLVESGEVAVVGGADSVV